MSVPKTVKKYLAKILNSEKDITEEEIKLAFRLLHIYNQNINSVIVEEKKTNNQTISSVDKKTEPVKNESFSSVIIGKHGEEFIRKILVKKNYNIISDSKTFHSGDFIIEINGIYILIEVKNYSNSVPSNEVKKMYNDINRTSVNAGLFISNSPISNIDKNIYMETSIINGYDTPVMFIISKNTENYFEELITYVIDILLSYCNKNKKIKDDIRDKINTIELQIQNASKIRVMLNELIQNNISKLTSIQTELLLLELRIKETIKSMSLVVYIDNDIKNFVVNNEFETIIKGLIDEKKFTYEDNKLVSKDKKIEFYVNKRILKCNINLQLKQFISFNLENINNYYSYNGNILTITVNELTFDIVKSLLI